MKKRGMLIFLCLILLVSCSGEEKTEKFSHTMFNTFDTVTHVVGYDTKEGNFKGSMAILEQQMKEYNDLFDIYHEYPGLNNVRTVNAMAGKEPVKVDEELIRVIEFSKEWYEKTDGKTNIAMGAVLKLWHDTREETDETGRHILPDKAALEEAAKHCNIDDVIIDKENSTVFLKDPKMSLDLGAIAKGYAVEQSAKFLEESGVQPMIISAGGDVRSIGKAQEANRDYWVVGIQNPDRPDDNTSLKAVIAIPEGYSVVTSGDYQRFFEQDGVRYHHLIDPETLMPADYFRAVTIVCPDSGLADYLSTALFLSDFERGKAMAEEFGVDVMWIDKDGQVIMTEGFKARIQE